MWNERTCVLFQSHIKKIRNFQRSPNFHDLSLLSAELTIAAAADAGTLTSRHSAQSITCPVFRGSEPFCSTFQTIILNVSCFFFSILLRSIWHSSGGQMVGQPQQLCTWPSKSSQRTITQILVRVQRRENVNKKKYFLCFCTRAIRPKLIFAQKCKSRPEVDFAAPSSSSIKISGSTSNGGDSRSWFLEHSLSFSFHHVRVCVCLDRIRQRNRELTGLQTKRKSHFEFCDRIAIDFVRENWSKEQKKWAQL